ncbi:recombinase family protein [Gemmatimonadota bacterium]
MERKQAAGYCRCSTDEQFQSIPDQKTAIEAEAEKLGLEVVRWFEDAGKSGTNTERRPGFRELISVVENGSRDFQLLLVYDVSRWGRYGDPDEAAYWEFHCKRHGVEVEYIAEDFVNDGSMGSHLQKHLKFSTAGQYSKDLARVTVRGNKSNAEKGFFGGGQPPYGYRRMLCESDGTPLRQLGPGERKVGDQKVKLALGPEEEVKTVRRIFRLYTVHGYTVKGIVTKLNEERQNGGVPSPRGGAWSVSTVHGILRNPVHCGRIVWGRRCYHHLIYPVSIGMHHDEDDWAVCEDAHEAIVSVDMWDKAQKGARHNAAFRKPKATSPYLLTGLIRCTYCGHNFQGRRKPGGKEKPHVYNYYQCGGYQRFGPTECISFSIPKEELETQIIKAIRRRLKRSGALDRIARDLEQSLAIGAQEPNEKLADLEAEIGRLEMAERRILQAVEEGMPYSSSRKRMEDLQARRDQITQEIAEWQAQENAGGDPAAAHEEIMTFLGDFDRILSCGDLEERRAFIRCFVEKIEVDPETEDIKVTMFKVPGSAPKAMEEIAATTE